MSDPADDAFARRRRLVPEKLARTVDAVRVDLTNLHGRWMCLVYGEDADRSSVEQRRPRTTRGAVGVRLWAVLGTPVVAVVYPITVLGLATRYYARRIDRLTASLGVAGVVTASLVAWVALTAATYVSPIAFEGLVAVATAGVVATVSAVLALLSTRRPGRFSTVVLGYPLAVTAIFLPPVVASLYSPTLAAFVFPRSETLAIWLLDTVLDVGGLATFIRATFELEGLAYVGMWFGLAVPTGWGLGGLVALADAVRPAEPTDGLDDAWE